MSDKPISVGDLVVVVREPRRCGQFFRLGLPYRVTGFFHACRCRNCNERFAEPSALIDGKYEAIPLSWLKRIPPLDEIESEKRDEKLTEPA